MRPPSILARAFIERTRLMVAGLVLMLRNARVRLRLQAGVAIALAVGLLVYLLNFLKLLDPLHSLATDFLYHPVPANQQIVIISIDKKSLDELGPWPWPRAIHAALLDRISAAKPRVVAFDLIFSQPTPDDQVFAAAMKRAGNVILAATGVEAAAYPQEAHTLPSFDVVVLPDAILNEAALTVGHRMIYPDRDDIVRAIPTGIQSADTRYPAIGLAAAARFMGLSEIQFDLPANLVRVGNLTIPVDSHGKTLLNFTSPSTGINNYSYVDVLRGAVPSSAFADKIVFVGGTSTIEAENYAVPLQLGEVRTHNVHLQADLANMLISTPPLSLRVQSPLGQLATILGAALLVGLTLPHLRLLYTAIFTLLYLLLFLLFAFEMFNRGLIIPVFYPTLALVGTSAFAATFRYLSEERRRAFLTLLFRRYAPPENVGRIVDAIDRGELPLSGTRRMVTVLYADLRGFAALSEELAPETVLALVNRYLELALQAIQGQGGTVSKPMGDALIAIWNAPLDQPDHAARAIRAALEIRRNLARFEQTRPNEQKLNFGIGLATGWAVLGNINALGKIEYTLVGDTVNIAARISAFANNNQILADANTTQRAPPGVEVRELSPVRVRGRKEPLPIWEIRDLMELALTEEEEFE